MALIRWRPRDEWDPFSWISGFRDELDRFFNRSLAPWQPAATGLFEGAWNPSVDVFEDKDNVIVRADLPGLKKDEVDISLTGDTLTLKGEKKEEKEVKEEEYHRIERSYGSFHRSIVLPSLVDADKVKASFKDGVLEITLPKKEEERGKKIEIKS